MCGFKAAEVRGHTCRKLQGKGTCGVTLKLLSVALQKGTSIRCQLINYRKDGTPFWNILSVNPVYTRTDPSVPLLFIGFLRDYSYHMTKLVTLRPEQYLLTNVRECATFDPSPKLRKYNDYEEDGREYIRGRASTDEAVQAVVRERKRRERKLARRKKKKGGVERENERIADHTMVDVVSAASAAADALVSLVSPSTVERTKRSGVAAAMAAVIAPSASGAEKGGKDAGEERRGTKRKHADPREGNDEENEVEEEVEMDASSGSEAGDGVQMHVNHPSTMKVTPEESMTVTPDRLAPTSQIFSEPSVLTPEFLTTRLQDAFLSFGIQTVLADASSGHVMPGIEVPVYSRYSLIAVAQEVGHDRVMGRGELKQQRAVSPAASSSSSPVRPVPLVMLASIVPVSEGRHVVGLRRLQGSTSGFHGVVNRLTATCKDIWMHRSGRRA